LLELCDRIAVIYAGRIMKMMSVEEADERTLGLLMAGVKLSALKGGASR
jgi:general nucleoside transport system ATP-binding protein